MARTKKSLKKIQGLIFLMLITLIFGITATYAWFSTQRDVEIAGMRLNVEVAESMQISLDGEKWAQSIQIADMRQFYGTYNASGDGVNFNEARGIEVYYSRFNSFADESKRLSELVFQKLVENTVITISRNISVPS